LLDDLQGNGIAFWTVIPAIRKFRVNSARITWRSNVTSELRILGLDVFFGLGCWFEKLRDGSNPLLM